jgi:16S rRNA (adenine1518-N6/adenine1519-N6)-dimethyltransferase
VALAAAAFQQRRKMLRRSLDSVIEDPEAVLRRAGIDPTARAEDVEPLGFVRLAAEVAS